MTERRNIRRVEIEGHEIELDGVSVDTLGQEVYIVVVDGVDTYINEKLNETFAAFNALLMHIELTEG